MMFISFLKMSTWYIFLMYFLTSKQIYFNIILPFDLDFLSFWSRFSLFNFPLYNSLHSKICKMYIMDHKVKVLHVRFTQCNVHVTNTAGRFTALGSWSRGGLRFFIRLFWGNSINRSFSFPFCSILSHPYFMQDVFMAK